MNLMTTLPRSLVLGLILTLASPAAVPAEPFKVNGKPIPRNVAMVIYFIKCFPLKVTI